MAVLSGSVPVYAPAAMQGNTDHLLSLYGGKETYIRYFFGEAISRVGGAGPEYEFWNIWFLKVPKTCTRPRAPRQCRGIQNMWRGRFGSRGDS